MAKSKPGQKNVCCSSIRLAYRGQIKNMTNMSDLKPDQKCQRLDYDIFGDSECRKNRKNSLHGTRTAAPKPEPNVQIKFFF